MANNRAIIEPDSALEAQQQCDSGITCIKDGDYNGAIVHFTRVIALMPTPENYAAYFNRGTCFMKIDNMEAAIVDFKRTLSVNPSYYRAHTNLGIAHMSRHRTREAIIQFTKAIAIHSTSFQAHYHRSLAYCELNDIKKAIDNMTYAIINHADFNRVENSQERTLSTITNLPDQLAIPMLLSCLDKKSVLGKHMWQWRGLTPPSLSKGVLKDVLDELEDHQIDTSQYRIAAEKETMSWFSLFTREAKRGENHVYDARMYPL